MFSTGVWTLFVYEMTRSWKALTLNPCIAAVASTGCEATYLRTHDLVRDVELAQQLEHVSSAVKVVSACVLPPSNVMVWSWQPRFIAR